ncbi:MAG: sulfite exporter TauE/SafE family protein [Saprospiraceae bacterium]|nr:sulfite exporter TauE/SafE family protein [Saprospiraceae bacterium]
MSNEINATLTTALLLGLAGSVHCVGMCGPLLLALPMEAGVGRKVLRQTLLYHGGRILMYAALGILFGLLGKTLALAGMQKALSVGAGLFMLLMAFMAWRFERLVTALPGFDAFTRRVKNGMSYLLRQKPNGSHFMLGALNGLLPCGMVYAAIAGAIATTSGAEGGLFMATFGTGTLPLLLGVSFLRQKIGAGFRQKIRVLQPFLMTIVAILLLQRGLHLDLALFESAVPKAGYDCH